MSRTYLLLLAGAGVAASVAIAMQIKPKPAAPMVSERFGAVATQSRDVAPASSVTPSVEPCQAKCEADLKRSKVGMGMNSLYRCVATCQRMPRN